MKNYKALCFLSLLISALYSCSKGNEHLSRDLYTPVRAITFDVPAIATPTKTKGIAEFSANLNLDSIIKGTAGSDFSVADIESIKLMSMKMDVITFDTTYNFRLIDSMQVKLKAGIDTTTFLARVISNPDVSSQTLNLPLSTLQPDLKTILKVPGVTYSVTGKIRRPTTQAFKASLTAQYKITIGN
jgi:hypothetical protein